MGCKEAAHEVLRQGLVIQDQQQHGGFDRMWFKKCYKPPIWEWFIGPIYGDLGGWFIVVLRALPAMPVFVFPFSLFFGTHPKLSSFGLSSQDLEFSHLGTSAAPESVLG